MPIQVVGQCGVELLASRYANQVGVAEAEKRAAAARTAQ